MINRFVFVFPNAPSRLLKSNSSETNNSELNPPMARNALASQKINDPAHHFRMRLVQFQSQVRNDMPRKNSSNFIVTPPPRNFPSIIASAASANNSREGCESASTKTIQSPFAAAAPALRARADRE